MNLSASESDSNIIVEGAHTLKPNETKFNY
jgi:hypothetical protein